VFGHKVVKKIEISLTDTLFAIERDFYIVFRARVLRFVNRLKMSRKYANRGEILSSK